MPDPHITLLSVLFLLGAAQGVFFAVTLLTRQMANKSANRYLAFLLLVFATDLFSEFLDNSLYGLQYLRLMILICPTDFLYGPLVWLYTSTMTARQTQGNLLRIFIHFVPTLILVSVVWPLLFQSLTEDANFLIDHPELIQGNQIQPWISPSFAQVFAALQMAFYIFLCLWRLHQHASSISNEFSYQEGVSLSWLRHLLFALVGLYILFVIRFLIADLIDIVLYSDIVLNIGIVVVIYAMAYFGMRQPEIFTRLSSSRLGKFASTHYYSPSELSSAETKESTKSIKSALPQGRIDQIAARPDLETKSKAGKYKHSALTSEMSAHILNRLTATMEQEKPYLKNNLTLPELAEMVSTSPNYLSQVINEQLQMSFFDYVNSYRIETAKQLFINPLPHTQTILDVAMESAFNSKSAFYNAFKKQTGITPAEFKKGHC